ncbi:hypothetical protein AAMO2058_000926900 [Amorphochlora amoebiformis]
MADFFRILIVSSLGLSWGHSSIYTPKTEICWTTKEIPVVDYSDLTLEDFYTNYSNYPLIIKGLASQWPAFNWSFDSIGESCPEANIVSMKFEMGNWGSLGAEKEENFAAFAKSLGEETCLMEDCSRYGFDFQIVDECPELTHDFKIPRFFSQCLLQKAFRKEAPEDPFLVKYSWPTLMMGPTGTRSEAHYDQEGLPFWMAVFEGKKIFRIIPPAENQPLIEEGSDFPGVLRDSVRSAILPEAFKKHYYYDFEMFRPMEYVDKYPRICDLTVREGFVEAGDIIYIPNSSPHGAVNLSPTIAVTANYASPIDIVATRFYRHRCEEREKRSNYQSICHTLDNLGKLEFDDVNYFEYAGSSFEDWCLRRQRAYNQWGKVWTSHRERGLTIEKQHKSLLQFCTRMGYVLKLK